MRSIQLKFSNFDGLVAGLKPSLTLRVDCPG
eukprot:COSAG06_NODE_40423_length_402_cov_0.709571_2_plen_30_part_01